MSDIFTDDQTRYLLDAIGVHVVSDTDSHWMCLCPFHSNTNSPAMVVDKEEGVYLCNNAACDARGGIRQMIQAVTGKTLIQTEFLILNARRNAKIDMAEYIAKKVEAPEFPKYPQERVEKNLNDFWRNDNAVRYMTEERHFEERTLKEFKVGYIYDRRSNLELVTVPMFDQDGNPVGFIGRGLNKKVFKNSKKLPRKHTLFNVHNAKKASGTITTEASFDAMRAWQATGIHAIATLGSYLGDGQADQISKYFSRNVLAVDDDKEKDYKAHCRRCRRNGHDDCQGHNTGYELGLSIVDSTPGVMSTWAHLNSLKRFDGAKDFGDLTDEQIKYAVDNAISNYQMMRKSA